MKRITPETDELFERELKIATRLSWIIIGVSSVLSVGLLGGIVYVAIHFLKKVW